MATRRALESRNETGTRRMRDQGHAERRPTHEAYLASHSIGIALLAVDKMAPADNLANQKGCDEHGMGHLGSTYSDFLAAG